MILDALEATGDECLSSDAQTAADVDRQCYGEELHG
jgi:hypothetical protein